MRLRVRWLTAIFGTLVLGLAGCTHVPGLPPPEPAPVIAEAPPPVAANGSIYQMQRGSLALFEDRRPRRTGDIITVVLDEQVSASKNANSAPFEPPIMAMQLSLILGSCAACMIAAWTPSMDIRSSSDGPSLPPK